MKFAGYLQWDQLPDGADALFEHTAADSIFFSRPWFENLVEHGRATHQRILLACVVDGERLLAMLPLMERTPGDWHAFGHLYTSLYTLLLGQNRQQDIVDCLVQGLEQLEIHSLRLYPIAEQDAHMNLLQSTLADAGYACHRYFRFYNWVHHVNGRDYHHYLSQRPARVRNTIARKQRKLQREQGYDIRLYIDRDIDQALADYNAVYRASWKANEVFDGFVTGLAGRLANHGWLRLAVLYIDGQPAAAQFWFVVGRKASIFKLVYDEKWKQYSPGSILTAYLMEYAIDTDKVEEIDFLTGNDAYKSDWMSERRVRWGLYCKKPVQPRSMADRLNDRFKRWLGLTPHSQQ